MIMKTLLFGVLIAGLSLSFTLVGGPLKPHQEKQFTWYGVDFRLAKFIGSSIFSDPAVIQKEYLAKWNDIILVERKKYDIQGALKIKNYGYKIQWMTNMNKEVDVAANIQSDSYAISKEKIETHVKSYDGVEGEGVGIVFIVESLNKLEQAGFMWVTFFDEKTKEIIYTERMSGAAQGFGIRNYWAGTFYNVVKEIKDKRQKKWFKKK